MDNLETNTKAMQELASLLSAREIPFDAEDRRIMCFPHIINIISQHVITKMSKLEPPELDDDDEIETAGVELGNSTLNTANTRQAAYDRDPIARCRKIVVAIRSSGQRREKFESWIKTGWCFLPLHAMIGY
jgi:hypothetical protein